MARVASFEVAADRHGRDIGSLEPAGGTLTIDISNVANGGYLPGDRDDLEAGLHAIRVTTTKDAFLKFSSEADSDDATTSDILFLGGTESMTLPLGTCFVSAVVLTPADTGKLSVTVLR